MIKQPVTKQTTINNFVSCVGIGLHTGAPVKLSIHSAPADHGIVFKRMDVNPEHALVPARYDAVCETRLGTTIRNEFGITVATVEHLMAAIWGVGVDNALIELDGPEIPIMDGSSEPFIFMMECVGVKKLAKSRPILRILKTIEVREGDSIACVSPHLEGDEGTSITIDINFNHAVIGHQKAHYDFRDMTFKQSLSRARTFGFEHEVAALRKMGLALGGSLENAIVVGKDDILNEEGLRFGDEFVRHKALDCIGDLYLSGYRIDGRFTFSRPGHAINNKLLRTLFADESAYVIEVADAPAVPVSAPVDAPLVAAYA